MRVTFLAHFIFLNFIIVIISLVSHRFLLLRSKYSPHYPVLRHPQSTFFL